MAGNDRDLEDWAATVPFPLAAVLWVYAGEEDTRARLESAFHFFEATARYLAIVELSGLITDDRLWEQARQSWQGQGPPPSQMMARTTIGTWARLHADASKALRAAIHHEPIVVAHAFGLADTGRITAIASRDVVGTISDAVAKRNDWKGHDSATTVAERRRRADYLGQVMRLLRVHLGGALDDWQLIKPRSLRVDAAEWNVEAQRLDGPNPRLRSTSLSSTSELRTDRLYLTIASGIRPLPILPLLKVVQSDDVAEASSYFFDRVDARGVRWVSYDSATAAESHSQDLVEVTGLLRRLDALPKGADREVHTEPPVDVADRGPAQPPAPTDIGLQRGSLSQHLTAASVVAASSLGLAMRVQGSGFFVIDRVAWIHESGGSVELTAHVPIERAPILDGITVTEIPVSEDSRPAIRMLIEDRTQITLGSLAIAVASCIDGRLDLAGSEVRAMLDRLAPEQAPLSFGDGTWPAVVAPQRQVEAFWDSVEASLAEFAWDGRGLSRSRVSLGVPIADDAHLSARISAGGFHVVLEFRRGGASGARARRAARAGGTLTAWQESTTATRAIRRVSVDPFERDAPRMAKALVLDLLAETGVR